MTMHQGQQQDKRRNVNMRCEFEDAMHGLYADGINIRRMWFKSPTRIRCNPF